MILFYLSSQICVAYSLGFFFAIP